MFPPINIFWFFLILAKFVFFCQIFFSEGHFWNFEIMGNRQTQNKILKYCRKNHVLKIYILNNASKWKMDAIFIIKFLQALGLKLANRPVLWTITLNENLCFLKKYLFIFSKKFCFFLSLFFVFFGHFFGFFLDWSKTT